LLPDALKPIEMNRRIRPTVNIAQEDITHAKRFTKVDGFELEVSNGKCMKMHKNPSQRWTDLNWKFLIRNPCKTHANSYRRLRVPREVHTGQARKHHRFLALCNTGLPAFFAQRALSLVNIPLTLEGGERTIRPWFLA